MAAITPEELSRAFTEAINDGDVERALELWTPDAAMVGAGGETIRGRDALAAVLQALIDSGARVETEISTLHLAGSVAVATGFLTLSSPEGFTQRSSSVVLYERAADGSWRIALDAPWGLGEGPAAPSGS